MTVSVRPISFDEICGVWRDHLWPSRTSPIEPTSSIVYDFYPYEYDPTYAAAVPDFFGLFVGDELAGVNSGHQTDYSYRSRGLFVFPKWRGRGYGVTLLSATIDAAVSKNSDFIWSMPRESSIKTYEAAGFARSSDWFKTETCSRNCFVRIDLAG